MSIRLILSLRKWIPLQTSAEGVWSCGHGCNLLADPDCSHILLRNFTVSCLKYAKARGVRKKKHLSEKKLARYFVDQRRVIVSGGKGGDGTCAFHSEPRKEFGGPDGGNGGNGGHVILKVAQQVKSLLDIKSYYRGIDGEPGASKNCYGKNAAHTRLLVPIGTVVKEDGKVVADLSCHGEEYVASYGGLGGKGNRFFLSNENRAPTLATPGEAVEQRVLQLELRTMAHGGMVGFPNAGKSSLLRAISNAQPAVADYPFTTLTPHVGVIQYQDFEQIAVADIPGIIRGAHKNKGLGVSFLRHIERCRFLLFVLDLSTADPWQQLESLKYELGQYEKGLSERPFCVIGSKIDIPESKANFVLLQEKVKHGRLIPVSALTGENIEELLMHLRELYDGYLENTKIDGSTPVKW
ncbi:mitochondrial ribosome-associated GTPase 2 isoform X2 [Rhinoraja longicauda]